MHHHYDASEQTISRPEAEIRRFQAGAWLVGCVELAVTSASLPKTLTASDGTPGI